MPSSQVTIGSTVQLKFSDGMPCELCIVDTEGDPEFGTLSVLSPLGAALLGRYVREKIRYRVGDKQLEVEIIAVR